MDNIEKNLREIEKISVEISSLIKQGVKDFTITRLEQRHEMIEKFFDIYAAVMTQNHQQRLESILTNDKNLQEHLDKEQHSFNKSNAAKSRLKIYNQHISQTPF